VSAAGEISLGYSPCPNDTFIFCALSEGRVDTGGTRVRTVLADVEALNLAAKRRELDVTKISFHAFAHLRDRYALLSAGAALGRGCGPLLVAREPLDPSTLRGRGPGPWIAIPGELTTAALLLRLYAPGLSRFLVLPFDRIFDAVGSGRAEAGLIIHEGRFTYSTRGLVKVIDLGEWWEKETGMPLPLGGIIAARDLGPERIREIEGWVRESVRRARRRPEEAMGYVRAHAQEMEDPVIRSHIDLYVNDFTGDLGEEGRRAVEALFSMAEARGIVSGEAAR